MSTDNLSKTELLALRPLDQLAGYGPVGANGLVRDDLLGPLSSAACLQFERAEVAPQELLTVSEALRQAAEFVDADTPSARFTAAVEAAFDATVGLLRKDIHPALHAWVYEWRAFVDTQPALEAFLAHMQSVASLYALVQSRKAR